ncbi:PH domain-containing protein [Actinotalea sp. Marseille-Q4924]|uniref:PH domain-containing protein n=1 Tax=Actinotalea sp. Marseille-Q4924 TaxID=2866571 RepID=UPI001CE3F0B2|nr:PH domain-containing protein [Actinotalea sp. Marseille-Q4924]
MAGPAPVDVGTAGADDQLRWQRFHPVTPVVKGWKIFVVLLFVAGQQVSVNVTSAQRAVDAVGWWPVLALMGLVLLAGVGYSALAWRMTRYAIGDEAVHLRQGVLFRQHRAARLDRIQAIDVVQPLLARIMGLAELKVEVAGGSDSGVALSFLRESEAQELRAEILARAAGVRFGRTGAGGEGAAGVDGAGGDAPRGGGGAGAARVLAPTAPERELIAVPPGRLVASIVLSGAAIAAAVTVAAVLVVAVVMREVGPVLAAFPVLLASVGYLVQRFNSEFGFRAALSPDGIRLRHGFTSARAQTLPPGRVQAVSLVQPLLWRRRDWWRVQVNVAGYAVSEQQDESVLLPVGDREDALLALWLVLPDLGASDPRAVLDQALSGDGADGGFVTSPRRARWLDPLAWRRNGFALTERALLARSGRIVRRLTVVPHERTQSLGLVQGPWQRRLGLASFALHSTPGPVSPQVPHLDHVVAGDLMLEQAHRARTARAAAGPERWMDQLQSEADRQPAEVREAVALVAEDAARPAPPADPSSPVPPPSPSSIPPSDPPGPPAPPS